MSEKETRRAPSRRGPGGGGPGRGMAPTEKAQDFSGSVKKLLIYARKYWPVMIAAIICAIIGTILTLLGPDRISDLTAEISAGLTSSIDMDAIQTICFTLVGIYAVSAVLTFIEGWLMADVSSFITRALRDDISHKINRLPMAFFHNTTTGDIFSRITNDVDTISSGLSSAISSLISAVVLFFGCLFMMLKTDVTMTLTAVLSTIFGFALMMVITSRSQKYFTSQQESLGELNGFVEEIYSGHTIVKAYNGEKKATAEFDKLNESLKRSGFIANAMSGLMQPIMGFIGNFGYVAVCVVGAILTMNGTIGFEVIIAFMMYVRYFTQPLQQVAQGIQRLQSTAAAGERVFDFLEAEEMADESAKPITNFAASGDIIFDNIKFGYSKDKEIIHGFSARARKGQKVAIVGPTGAGKTTIVNLLMRFYELDSGDIWLDNVKTSDLRREEVRNQFCMVLQDTWVFQGTIRENLVYNQEGITDEQIEQACKAVGLHHYIRTLPKGYDTVLNDSVSLSQGQKQQLTIARAMLTDRPMLILDEATSSVDTRTELQIQDAMDKLMTNRTSFVIAHRLSTIKNADLILVLRAGDIVEAGTHESLLENGGFYAELYNSQFEDAEAFA